MATKNHGGRPNAREQELLYDELAEHRMSDDGCPNPPIVRLAQSPSDPAIVQSNCSNASSHDGGERAQAAPGA